MLTDFFIANRAEIDSLNSILELEDFPMVKAKRVDPVKISTLDELLTGAQNEILEPIKEFDSGNSWIFPVRTQLITALANSKTGDLNKVSSDWAQTDEWKLDNANERELNEFLRSVSELASLAEEQEKEIFVLISV